MAVLTPVEAPEILPSGTVGPPREFKVNEWKEMIRNGQRFQIWFARSNKWPTYKRYYRHEFKAGTIPVNLVFSLLRSMVPQVYFKNPRVTITPRKPGLEAELNARIVQTIDNWLIQELMTKREMKKMISDSFLAGLGSGFIGYDSEYGFDPSKLDPETGQFTLTQFNKRGWRTEYNASVSPGMPWFLRARPEDVVYPWGCESARNAEWVALRVFRPTQDLRADPKYTNTSGLEGSFTISRTAPEGGVRHDPMQGSLSQGKGRLWTELWQIHDARTGKVLGLTMNHDKFLRKQTDEMQIDGLPVETVAFNPDPDFIYGIPDARLIEPQLLELNEIRTQAMHHRRIDIVKFMYSAGAIDDTELQKLTSEKVMAGVKVNVEGDIGQKVINFNANVSGILQDLAGSGEIARGDTREMVGFSRIAQGEFQGKTHVSAAETKAVFQSLNIRLDERRDDMADLLTRIVRKFNQIIFKHWTRERVSQIVGPDGAKWWVKYTGKQIADEYDTLVSPEEGPTLDSSTKFQQAREAASAWAELNQGAISQGMPIPMEIQRLLFSQFADTGLDIDRLIAQTNAVSQQAQQALGAQGQSQGAPVSPGVLAAALGGAGGGA